MLAYDPDTGVFTWREPPGRHRMPAGAPAGCASGSNGYRVIAIDGTRCYAQVLAWLLLTGEWPNGIVAFRDRDRRNLRAANLTMETAATNQQRRSRPKSHSKTQILGVAETKGKERPYSARITVDGHCHRLGRFRTAEEASQAYQEAKRRLHQMDGMGAAPAPRAEA